MAYSLCSFDEILRNDSERRCVNKRNKPKFELRWFLSATSICFLSLLFRILPYGRSDISVTFSQRSFQKVEARFDDMSRPPELTL